MTDTAYPGPYNGSLPLIAGTAGDTIAVRDSAGRLQAVAPSAAADVATKTYVDTTQPAALVAAGQAIGVLAIPFGHADLTTAGTAQAVDLSATVPENIKVIDVWVNQVEVGAGGTISALTMQLGDAGDPNGLMTAIDVFTGSDLGLRYQAGTPTEYLSNEAALGLIATMTSTAGNLDTATTGSWIVYLRYLTLPI